MTATTYTVWMACPADDGEHWLPWQLAKHNGQFPFTSHEAHRLARCLRWWWPGHLVAVRPDNGSQPVWPALMADHYDLPPYAD